MCFNNHCTCSHIGVWDSILVERGGGCLHFAESFKWWIFWRSQWHGALAWNCVQPCMVCVGEWVWFSWESGCGLLVDWWYVHFLSPWLGMQWSVHVWVNFIVCLSWCSRLSLISFLVQWSASLCVCPFPPVVWEKESDCFSGDLSILLASRVPYIAVVWWCNGCLHSLWSGTQRLRI